LDDYNVTLNKVASLHHNGNINLSAWSIHTYKGAMFAYIETHDEIITSNYAGSQGDVTITLS